MDSYYNIPDSRYQYCIHCNHCLINFTVNTIQFFGDTNLLSESNIRTQIPINIHTWSSNALSPNFTSKGPSQVWNLAWLWPSPHRNNKSQIMASMAWQDKKSFREQMVSWTLPTCESTSGTKSLDGIKTVDMSAALVNLGYRTSWSICVENCHFEYCRPGPENETDCDTRGI